MRIWCDGQLDWEGLACYVVAINLLRGHFVHCCSPRKFSVIVHLRHQVKLNWTLVSFDAHTPMTTILWVVVTYQSCELKTHALFPVVIKLTCSSMLIWVWCGGGEGGRTLFHSLHTVRREAYFAEGQVKCLNSWLRCFVDDNWYCG